jgi:hypothetical protein
VARKSLHITMQKYHSREGKTIGNFRKRATQFLEIYKNKNKVITLERVSIGEDAFDNILNEFKQLL